MKKELWILVANSSVARIFKKNGSSLVSVKVLEHPESRLHNRDLVSDKPGRDFESIGAAKHSYEPQHSPHEVEVINFSREISSFLQTAKNNEQFDDLYLAANPSMLGLLRQNLSSEIAKITKETLDKDLTQMMPEEIINHFTFTYL